LLARRTSAAVIPPPPLHDALPICQITEGRTGACDRYANVEGVLTRVDPVVLMRRLQQPSIGEPQALTASHASASEPPSTSMQPRSEEHTPELQSRENLVCRLPLAK